MTSHTEAKRAFWAHTGRLVEVRDEAELMALQAADPAIESSRGFRYESLPMLRLVH